MIYTPLTRKALKFAHKAHKGAKDVSGLPYVFHPYEVASSMPDETTAAAALLHDIVEDTKWTLEDLRDLGFPKRVVTLVEILTHLPQESYADYITRIASSGSLDAITIKLADIAHNMDASRLKKVRKKDEKRFEKYSLAIVKLTGALEGVAGPDGCSDIDATKAADGAHREGVKAKAKAKAKERSKEKAKGKALADAMATEGKGAENMPPQAVAQSPASANGELALADSQGAGEAAGQERQ